MTFVFKAAVVGAGITGGEIVHAIASAGIPVALADPDGGALDQALSRARALWQRQVDEGVLSADELEHRLALIGPTTAYDGFGEVDFAIEAVRERMDLQETVFAALDQVTPGHAILATACSSPVITELGDVTGRAGRVIGFHFLRPVAATRVVEIVEGEYTSPETVQAATRFAQTIRRLPIVCGEAPGFVVTRIIAACAADGWRIQHESGAGPEEVDRIIVDAGACPVGPFMLADRIGLDEVLRVTESLRESYGGRFYVHPEMADLVEAGHDGVTSGTGFYDHA